jgi:hypothetical protein
MSERPDPKTVYTTRVSGLWSSRHEFHENGERVGLLEVKRNPFGIVTEGVYRPEKGAVLTMDRDPGLRIRVSKGFTARPRPLPQPHPSPI